MEKEKPKKAGLLPKAALVIAFVLSWLALTALILRTIENIWPAMTVYDPASLAAGALLIPMAVFLLQSLIHLPRRQRRPVFLRARGVGSFSILLFPAIKRLEPGPALDIITTPADREAIMAEAAANMKYAYSLIPRLALLLDNRSPLEVLLRRLMNSRSRPLAALGWLFFLIVGPARQFTRLWGYVFTRMWPDPGPEDELFSYKRKVAFDLAARAARFGMDGMNFAEARNLLAQIWQELKRVHNDPFYGQDLGEALPDGPEDIEPNEEVAAFYRAPWLAPRYYGVYLDLPVTLGARTAEEMYDAGRDEDISVFYPPELGKEVESAAWLLADRGRLQIRLAEQREEGIMRTGGRPVPSWTINSWLFDIEGDLQYYEQRIAAHHRRCRTAHLTRARRLGRGWPEYLRGMAGILHFAEHARRALDTGKNDFEQFTNSRESLAEAARLHHLMTNLHERLSDLTADLHERLSDLDLTEEMETRPPDRPPLALSAPSVDFKAWLEGWEREYDEITALLSKLRDKALTALLWGEDQVAGRGGGEAAFAPPAPGPAPDFVSVRPGMNVPERVYSMADRLKVGFGRSLLAALFLALLLWQSQTLGRSRLVIYNGLGRDVAVWVGDEKAELRPYGRATVRLQPGREYDIMTTTGDLPSDGHTHRPSSDVSPEAAEARRHLIEHFSRRLLPVPSTEIYNIAEAAPLMRWRNPAGQNDQTAEFLGRPRWLKTEADILFRAPSSQELESPHLLVSGYGELPPSEMLPAFPDLRDQGELIYIHALWDKPGTSGFWQWQALTLGDRQAEILIQRLAREPDFLEQCVRQMDLMGIQ